MLRPNRGAIATLIALSVGVATVASAQSSPLADLLMSARASLNDLNSPRADSLAQMALRTYANRITVQQQIEALMISAAARYPEPYEGSEQYPDSAMVALRRIIRLDVDYQPRSEITWAGLDSLMTVARATTFAPRLRTLAAAVLTPDSVGVVAKGTSALRARWRWALRVDTVTAPVFSGTADHTTEVDIALAMRLDGEQPSIPSGRYLLEITAEDERNTDTRTWSSLVDIDAPPLVLRPIPGALGPADLLRESAPPARIKGVAIGIFAAGVTVLGSSMLRSSTELGDATSADGRAVAVGVLIALGATAGGYLDKGTDYPQNREENVRRMRAREDAVRAATAENEELMKAYRGTARVVESPR